MHIVENEQAREALRFTALAVGLLLVLRFGLAAALHLVPLPASDALVAAASGYHGDHILRQPGTVVMGAWPWMARLALASLVAGLCAVVVAVVCGGIAVLTGRSGITWALPAARISLLVCGLWCIAAVFLLPPRAIQFSKKGVVLVERNAILGQVSLPGRSRMRDIPWNEVVSVNALEGDIIHMDLLNDQKIEVDLPVREGHEPGTSVGVSELIAQIRAVQASSNRP